MDWKVVALFSVVLLIGTAAHGQNAHDSNRGELKSIEKVISDAQAGVDFITAEHLKGRIAVNRKLVLLDVRTEQEYAAGHLKGATWLERGIVEFVMVRQLRDPQSEIVVYCKVGNRTGLAVKALKKAGYRKVVGLQGGFDEWARKGNAVHNYLGEFRLIKLRPHNAALPVIDFYEPKD